MRFPGFVCYCSAMTQTYYLHTNTPAGTLLLTSNGTVLTGAYWEVFVRTPAVQPTWIEDRTSFHGVLTQLDEYFAGHRQTFDIAFQASGTPFQMAVWRALATIPYGQSCTYSDIAAQIGRPRALRAVGTAIGGNPLSIIVPCHRVLAAGNRITGYAGGVAAKARLLSLEGAAFAPLPQAA